MERASFVVCWTSRIHRSLQLKDGVVSSISSSHSLRRNSLGPSMPGQEKALQPDSNQPPTVGSDRPLAPSMEPEKPRHKGVRAIVWIGVLVFFVFGFFLVLRHSLTSIAPDR